MMERKPVPRSLQDSLLVECGYKCSVPRCHATDSLEFHHINGKPGDNRRENIIVLCAVHHHQADLKRIPARGCSLMKDLLMNLDGLSFNRNRELSLSKREFGVALEVAREISKESLRVIVEQYVSYLSGKNVGYRCRTGMEDHDFLLSRRLIYKAATQGSPPLWKISEKGILFCKFLFNSQYFLPFVAFDKNTPRREIIRWNFEKLPWE